MENQNHRLLRYLNDSYATEIGGIESLKDLAAITTEEQVKQTALEHLAQTQSQAERLAARILALGGDKSEPKGFVNAIIAKGSALVNIGHDHEDKQTQDLIKAYALEHFEIGAYTSLYAYASAIGDYETASLAQELRAEEEQAAVRFERLIPQLAVLAVNRTEEYTPLAKKSTARNLAPWLLVPGAALAFWGVSRLLQNAANGDADDQNFRTARQPNPEPTLRLTPDITETIIIVDEAESEDVVPIASTIIYDMNSENQPITVASSGSRQSDDYRANDF